MFTIGFQTDRSITIASPVEDVYSMIADFSTWRAWSPWICQEPDCPVDIRGIPGEIGHYQEWNGERIGAGNMQMVSAVPNERLEYELTFLKPFKSTAKTGFGFRSAEEGTEISWHMDGTLPFFLFFMKKKMSAWVGCDYERGLSMLKEKLETGEVLTDSDFRGVVERPAYYYVGRRTRCRIDDIGPKMEADFQQIGKEIENGTLPPPDQLFSSYQQFDFVTREADYVSGCIYRERPDGAPASDYVTGDVPAHRALQVIHTGAYRHLGNAWSTAMGARMALKKKLNNAVSMYEIYASDPHEVAEKDLVTSIYVPVK